MANDTERSAPFSLRRWSQRKLAAGLPGDARPDSDARPGDPKIPDAAAGRTIAASSALREAAPAGAARTAGAPANVAEVQAARVATIPLPPLESLTIDSDFSPFMQPGVDEAVKRSALRTLLRHPRFNVMDGLDVYIDDYSKPSPLEPELARTLMQARYIFDPPKTRVTADGIVEDVPDTAEDAVARADDDAKAPLADGTVAGDGEASAETVLQAHAGHEDDTRVPAAILPADEPTQ